MSWLNIATIALAVIAIGCSAYSLHLVRKTRRIQAQTRQIMNSLAELEATLPTSIPHHRAGDAK